MAPKSLGYHPYPAAIVESERVLHEPQKALKLQQCAAFCERYVAEHFAKASPQTVILPALLNRSNYELRANCQVRRINLDSTRKKATGVTYVDAGGVEYEQPADLVLITAFPLNNVRVLLLSGIGNPMTPRPGREPSAGTTPIRRRAAPRSSWTRTSTLIRLCLRRQRTMIDDFAATISIIRSWDSSAASMSARS